MNATLQTAEQGGAAAPVVVALACVEAFGVVRNGSPLFAALYGAAAPVRVDIHPDAMGALLVDPNVTEASIVECIKQGSGRHIVDYDEWARKVRVVVIHAAWRRHRRLCEAVKSLFTTAAFFVSSGGETSPLESGEPLYAVLESHQHPFCLRCITRMRPAGASAYVCPACGSIA